MAKINFSVSYVKRTLNKIEELKITNSNLEKELEKETDEAKKTGLQNAIESNKRTIVDLENELRNEIEEEIGRLNRHADRMSLHLDKVLASLKLEFNIEETDTRDLLKGLSEELGDINKEANELKVAIGEFKEFTNQDVFDLPLEDVINKITNIKERVRELKREQIRKYNDRVERIKLAIEEYKVKFANNQEALNLLTKASDGLSKCDANVRDWQAIGFLDQINYAKLADAVRIIKEVEGLDKVVVAFGSLDDHLNYIRTKVAELEVVLSMDETMDYSTYMDATVKLGTIKDLLLAFNNELEKNKDQLSPEKYQEYLNAHRDLMVSYMSLEDRLQKIGKNVVKGEVVDYNCLSNELKTIETDVNRFDAELSALFGKVTDNVKELFENELKRLNDDLESLVKKVDALYNDKTIDDNQYQNLKCRISAVEDKLEKANLKVKDAQMYVLAGLQDVYSFLNGEIDKLEGALNSLEEKLSKLEKPIKDRNARKEIDARFKRLEAEIKLLENQLEMDSDKDSEKYKETKERLDKAKKKIGIISKNYRRKCPFLVRQFKSAKHFFKKYKKVLLIAAGLAAFAMLYLSVIIPAIIHGNIMIAGLSPALRGPISNINNLLGGLIGAKQDNLGLWQLANGVILNPSVASASLLKGLAISGIGSLPIAGSMIAAVIIAIKKLIEKMKKAELKEKLISRKDKIVEKTKEKITTISQNARNKKAYSLANNEMIEIMSAMFKDYSKSGLSVDEYCIENGITGVMAEMLKQYEQTAQKNKDDFTSKKGGR